MDTAGYSLVKTVLGGEKRLLSGLNNTEVMTFALGDAIYIYGVRGRDWMDMPSPGVGTAQDEIRKNVTIGLTQLAAHLAMRKGTIGKKMVDVALSLGASGLFQNMVVDPFLGPSGQKLLNYGQ